MVVAKAVRVSSRDGMARRGNSFCRAKVETGSVSLLVVMFEVGVVLEGVSMSEMGGFKFWFFGFG